MSTTLELYCFVLGDDPECVFPVKIGKHESVGTLKDLIKVKKEPELDHLAAGRLRLSKVSLPVDNNLQNNLSDLPLIDKKRLVPTDRLSTVFPDPPLEGHILIFVEAPRTAQIVTTPAKRSGSPSMDSGKQKMPHIEHTGGPGVLPSEGELTALHTALKKVSSTLEWYSDPTNMGDLPFSLLYPRLPTERFRLIKPSPKVFQYMGRQCFSELYKLVLSMEPRGGPSQLYLQGSIGFGKSHILAALACLLHCNDKRPVYLPDCRQMLDDPLAYIQSALLCSFADSSSSATRDEIRRLASLDEVFVFCRRQVRTPLYFIIDQVNALEHEGTNTDVVQNSKKDDLTNFLRKIVIGHFSITSASANYRTARHMERKQTGELKVSMMGGLSDIEMKEWWHHHKEKVPYFKDEAEKMRVQELTGCIPLLLTPFLESGKQDFCDAEKSILNHQDLVAVERNVLNFANEIRRDRNLEYDLFVLTLFRCLTHTSVKGTPTELFDYRYFYPDDEELGSCPCGLAREAALAIIRDARPDKFLDPIHQRNLCKQP